MIDIKINNPIVQMKMVTNVILNKLNGLLKKYDLTSTQAQVLKYLIGHKSEIVTQNALQDVLGIQHSTMSGIISRLEDKGFIKAESLDRDRRCKHIIITNKTIEIGSIIESETKDFLRSSTTNISTSQIEDFVKTLNIIYCNLQKDNYKI